MKSIFLKGIKLNDNTIKIEIYDIKPIPCQLKTIEDFECLLRCSLNGTKSAFKVLKQNYIIEIFNFYLQWRDIA